MMKCQSCGRPSESMFCRDCTDNTGALRNFDEIVENLTGYYVETQGFDRDVAKSVAIGVLSHQPAWEKKITQIDIKARNKKRFLLVLSAVVLALASSGITWYVGWRNRGVFYYNYSPKSQNPFMNVSISNNHDLGFIELKCPSDQKLVSIEDDMVTFKSLQGSLYSPVYDYYVYDIADEEGAKVDRDSPFFNTIMHGKPNGIEFTERFKGIVRLWHFNPETKKYTMFPGDYVARSKKHVLVATETGMDVYDIGTEKFAKHIKTDGFRCEAAISDNFVVFNNRIAHRITIDRFDGKTFEFPIIGEPQSIQSNDRYVLINWWVNANSDIFVCYDGLTGKIFEFADKNVMKVVISNGDNPDDTVIAWNSYERVQEQTQKYKYSLRFVRLSNPDDIKTKLEILEGGKGPIPLAVTSDYLLWDIRKIWRTNTRDKWIDGAVTDYGLRFLDLKDGREFVIEENNCDNVIVDGWNAAWEVYRGNENDEFFNIKVANFEQTNKYWNEIAKQQTKSEIFGNIETKKSGSIQVYEIRAKFDQCISSKISETNISLNDNLALISSQGNNEDFVFNPKLRLASRFDSDSADLRKILGEKKLSWQVTDNYFDPYDGFRILKTRTYDPKNGKITDEFIPKNHYKDYYVDLKNGKYILSLRKGDGTLEKVFESENYYTTTFVTKSNNGKWLVFVSNDKKERSTLHVYDFQTKTLKTLAKSDGFFRDGIFASKSRLFYRLNGEDFERIMDLSTGQMQKMPFKIQLLSLGVFNTDNPIVGFVDDRVLNLAFAEDILSRGAKAFRRYDIGKNVVPSIIGDWIVLPLEAGMKPDPQKDPGYERNINEIALKNMKTGERILLEKGTRLQHPEIIGEYLYWIHDRGRVNLEFENICFAKLK